MIRNYFLSSAIFVRLRRTTSDDDEAGELWKDYRI